MRPEEIILQKIRTIAEPSLSQLTISGAYEKGRYDYQPYTYVPEAELAKIPETSEFTVHITGREEDREAMRFLKARFEDAKTGTFRASTFDIERPYFFMRAKTLEDYANTLKKT